MSEPSRREPAQQSNAELSKVFRKLFTVLFTSSVLVGSTRFGGKGRGRTVRPGLESAKTELIKNRRLPISPSEVHLTLRNKEGRFASAAMRRRLLQPASQHDITMKAKRTTIVLSLLVTMAGATSLSVRADDEPAAPEKQAPALSPARKPVQQQLSGLVLSVDKYARTLTVQVNNLTYVLQITDSTRVARNSQERTLNDVVVGEEITVNVVLREFPNGRIEVAVLSVQLPASVAAQGLGQAGTFTNPPPFQNGPNPGNVDGPIISRHN